MAATITPSTFAEVADALATAAAAPQPVRVTGASTKLGWGGATPSHSIRLQMVALSRMLTQDPAAMTATLEAGMPLARAQRRLAQSGLAIPLDPSGIDAGDRGPTLGGVFATGDAGPLQHRYGGPEDLILGACIAFSDGTITKVGGQLARLFVGSFGTLGVLLSVTLRLSRRIGTTSTAFGATADPARLRDLVGAVAAAGQDLEAFDFAWRHGRGGALAQLAGTTATSSAELVATTMRAAGLEEVGLTEDDAALWARERAGQRSADRAVVRVSFDPDVLDQLLKLADSCEATVVGRAALGIAYLTLNVNRIQPLRAGLPQGARAVALDVPVAARGVVSPWDFEDGQRIALLRAVKHRFDPAGICNPGIFLGGI